MTPNAIRSALEAHLRDALAGVDVAWENVDYTPIQGTAWVRCVVRPGQVFDGEIGRLGLSQRPGVLLAQVFVPDHLGSGPALDMAQAVEAAFRHEDVGGVHCDNPYTTTVGPDGRGWYQVNVAVPWWAWVGDE